MPKIKERIRVKWNSLMKSYKLTKEEKVNGRWVIIQEIYLTGPDAIEVLLDFQNK